MFLIGVTSIKKKWNIVCNSRSWDNWHL